MMHRVYDTSLDQLDAIRKAFKARRKEMGVTCKEMSKMTSVNEGTIAKFEAGDVVPSLNKFIEMANYLGYKLTDMVEQEDIK